jgi:hypothetical protein
MSVQPKYSFDELVAIFKIKSTAYSIFVLYDQLADAAKRRGYDQWVTSTPPLKIEHKMPSGDPTAPITAGTMIEGLDLFMASILSRGWDIEKPVWLARRLDFTPLTVGDQSISQAEWLAKREAITGAIHDDETLIHPELINIYINASHQAPSHTSAETRANTLKEIAQGLPEGSGSYEDGFRNALESIILALDAEGVSAQVVAKSIATALDAYANHALSDEDVFNPAPAQ